MGPMGCPETLVKNYHYTLRHITEERRYDLLRSESLKSHKLIVFITDMKSVYCAVRNASLNKTVTLLFHVFIL